MKALYVILTFSPMILLGCQSLGDHYSCLAEVDRLVPPQTKQRYVKTETKCVRSNEQTFHVAGGYTSSVYNPGQGDINCSSTPVYETTILNQPQRDAAYQSCISRMRSTRASQYYQVPPSTPTQNCVSKKTDAEFNACMRGL